MTKGVYLSRGKTLAQMKAERATAEAADATPVFITMTRRERREIEAAAGAVQNLLSSAGYILDMLQAGFNCRTIDPEDPGTLCLMELAGRGFRAAAEDEGVAIERLGTILRNMEDDE